MGQGGDCLGGYCDLNDSWMEIVLHHLREASEGERLGHCACHRLAPWKTMLPLNLVVSSA